MATLRPNNPLANIPGQYITPGGNLDPDTPAYIRAQIPGYPASVQIGDLYNRIGGSRPNLPDLVTAPGRSATPGSPIFNFAINKNPFFDPELGYPARSDIPWTDDMRSPGIDTGTVIAPGRIGGGIFPSPGINEPVPFPQIDFDLDFSPLERLRRQLMRGIGIRARGLLPSREEHLAQLSPEDRRYQQEIFDQPVTQLGRIRQAQRQPAPTEDDLRNSLLNLVRGIL